MISYRRSMEGVQDERGRRTSHSPQKHHTTLQTPRVFPPVVGYNLGNQLDCPADLYPSREARESLISGGRGRRERERRTAPNTPRTLAATAFSIMSSLPSGGASSKTEEQEEDKDQPLPEPNRPSWLALRLSSVHLAFKLCTSFFRSRSGGGNHEEREVYFRSTATWQEGTAERSGERTRARACEILRGR